MSKHRHVHSHPCALPCAVKTSIFLIFILPKLQGQAQVHPFLMNLLFLLLPRGFSLTHIWHLIISYLRFLCLSYFIYGHVNCSITAANALLYSLHQVYGQRGQLKKDALGTYHWKKKAVKILTSGKNILICNRKEKKK